MEISWEHVTKQYRTFQVLEVFMNEVQQKVLVTDSISIAITLVPLTATMLIRIWQEGAQVVMASLLMFVLYVAVSVLLFMVGGMAGISVSSEMLLLQLRKGLIHVKRRTLKKTCRSFVNSCRPIYVKFGSLNYIEVLTALKCIDLAIQLTMQLLLVTNNK